MALRASEGGQMGGMVKVGVDSKLAFTGEHSGTDASCGPLSRTLRWSLAGGRVRFYKQDVPSGTSLL